MHAMEISRTGLEVEWRRLEVISENLANAGTVRTAGGGAYQPRHLISGPRGEFSAYLDRSHASATAQDERLDGVMVYAIEPDATPPRRAHEPDNPQADADGFVTYPAINHAEQMVLMAKTARVYEANIVAMNTARQMYAKALELGMRG
ncbi:flagellar basal body rod protein FlgC [Flavisphingomonas formosensis]|uniref:flagellar basal body rod protein FlgC n=1 Tax=Flavisphingomonas formosensis TaxID=861534 RepID=UPI0012F8D9C4|nr:flagellar basal body rod protein FlgC [Sphingomonas formosensis]